jgi:hypothetical protein
MINFIRMCVLIAVILSSAALLQEKRRMLLNILENSEIHGLIIW